MALIPSAGSLPYTSADMCYLDCWLYTIVPLLNISTCLSQIRLSYHENEHRNVDSNGGKLQMFLRILMRLGTRHSSLTLIGIRKRDQFTVNSCIEYCENKFIVPTLKML